jgi:hypothetical protein
MRGAWASRPDEAHGYGQGTEHEFGVQPEHAGAETAEGPVAARVG